MLIGSYILITTLNVNGLNAPTKRHTQNKLQTIKKMTIGLYVCAFMWVASVVSNSLWPFELNPATLLCPWGFSRQEYWSGLPWPPLGDLPNPGIESRSPASQADSLRSEPHNYLKCKWIKCTNQKTWTGWVDENMCMYAFPLITLFYLTPQRNVIILYC